MTPSESIPEQPTEQSFAVSNHQFGHLLERYGNFCEAAVAVMAALREKGIDAYIVVGGFQFFVRPAQMIDATIVLDEFGLDISKLSDGTFRQKLASSGSLEKLAAQDPMGFGARILRKISGDTN